MTTRPINQNLAMIDSLIIDCLVTESHSHESEVSEFPVESGATISDHIRNKPISIDLECIVSDTPFRPIAAPPGVPPSSDAYAQLMRIRDARKPVTIRTSIKTYQNMALKSLTIPRSVATMDCMMFTASFVQMTIVKNVRGPRVAIPAAYRKTNSNKPAKPNDLPDAPAFASLISVDPKTGHWFDPTIHAWRHAALYIPKEQRWHLYPLDVEKPQPDVFDGLRFTGVHPNFRVLLIEPRHYVIEGPS